MAPIEARVAKRERWWGCRRGTPTSKNAVLDWKDSV